MTDSEEYTMMADDENYTEKDTIPDLYKYLGLTVSVCSQPDCNEVIHKAYMRKALACHPDKHPGRTDVAEVFRLLTESYEILSTEKGRRDYNAKLQLSKQSQRDFMSLKKDSDAHYTAGVAGNIQATDEQIRSFKDQMFQRNLDHGYNASNEGVIDKQDARKRLNELTSMRGLQDQENLPENLFEGQPFNSSLFNAAFDKYHKKDDAIVPHTGAPSPWNDAGSVINYCVYDNLDNLYVDNTSRVDTQKQIYSEVDTNTEKPKRVSKKDLSSLKPADYVDGHSALGDDYYAGIKKKLAHRATLTEKYSTFNEFIQSDPETIEYRIHDQLYPDTNTDRDGINEIEVFNRTLDQSR